MIHPTATIETGAAIAEGVTIGPYCHVSSEATLEKGVILEPHVHIEGPVSIGKETHIFAFVHIGNGNASVSIGDRCYIREFTHIATEEHETGSVTIADSCYIMAYVYIHTDVMIEEGCTLTNNVILGKGCRCQSKVIVGAKATVAAGCTIGTGSMIGGVSAVTYDIPPYCLIEGYPHATIRGLNLVGMRRRFEDRKSISQVKKVFMVLKKSAFDPKVAHTLLSEIEDPHAKIFTEFVSQYKINIQRPDPVH